MGFVLTYKAARVLNLAHGGLAMFLAFFALWLTSDVGLPYGIAMAAAALAAVALGLGVDVAIMRPLRDRPPLDAAVASLGLLLSLQGLAVILWGSNPRAFPSPLPAGTIGIAGLQVTYHQLLVFATVAVVGAALAVFFKFTRSGVAIRAHVENPTSAQLLGVSPRWVSALAWSLAALLAGLAGVLLAPLTLLDTLRMPLMSVKALVAALVGGLDSLPGAILGGVVLGVSEAYFLGFVHLPGSADWLPFSLVLLALLFRGTRSPAGRWTKAT
jgi:branched-subunit amino acid ABC-type transport system permease component